MGRLLRLALVGVVVSVLLGACAPVSDRGNMVTGPGFTLLSPNADTSVAPALDVAGETLEQALVAEGDVNDELNAHLPSSLAAPLNATMQQQTESQYYGMYQDGVGCMLGGH